METVGDAALAGWDVALAAECFTHAKDLGSLLLLHSSTGNKEGLAALAAQAVESNAHNVAFSCYWLLGDIDRCVEALTKTDRLAEAVLFAQTYKPSLAVPLVKEWKESLEKNKKARVAKLIGVPDEDEDLFPEWDAWLKVEREGGAVDETQAPEEANGVAQAIETQPEGEGEAGAEAEEEAEAEDEE